MTIKEKSRLVNKPIYCNINVFEAFEAKNSTELLASNCCGPVFIPETTESCPYGILWITCQFVLFSIEKCRFCLFFFQRMDGVGGRWSFPFCISVWLHYVHYNSCNSWVLYKNKYQKKGIFHPFVFICVLLLVHCILLCM